MSKTLGLYVHIPFCRSKCDYCDFYSLPRSESRMDDYTDALCAHLAETAPFAAGHLVDTVYFGGGTPSYLGTKRLVKILKTILKKYKVDKQAEITLEANPDSAGDWKALRALRKAGFNDHEILEAAFVAGFFNYTNRWVSTIAPVANPGHFSHNRNFEG